MTQLDEHIQAYLGTVKQSAWEIEDSLRQIAELAEKHPEGDVCLSSMLGALYHPPRLDLIPRPNTYLSLNLERDQVTIDDGTTRVLEHIAPAGLTRNQQEAYRVYRLEGAPSLLAIELALEDGE